MSRRFQCSLRTLLVAILVVAAFFGGMVAQQQVIRLKKPACSGPIVLPLIGRCERFVLPDGSVQLRPIPQPL